MPNVLVHPATGPENATRAALALLVARTAVEEGHQVRVFLAGMSSKARGIDEGGELSPPAKLVELAVWADTVLTY